LDFGVYSLASSVFLRVNNFSQIIVEISLTEFLETALMRTSRIPPGMTRFIPFSTLNFRPLASGLRPLVSARLLLSTFAFLLSTFVPSAQAGVWNEQRYAFDLRSYDSPDFLILNSSFLLFRLPGSRLSNVRAPYIYDRDGDRIDSVYRYANDVGTLANPFNVMLFNNVATFAGGSGGSKTIAPKVAEAARSWNNTGTNFNAGASWGGTAPGSNDVASFTTAATTQPNVTASVTIAGLFFGVGGTGYDLTSSSTSTVLTLNGVNTTGSNPSTTASAAAIRNDNTTGTETIDAPLSLASSTGTSTFFQETGDGTTLILNGVISESAAGKSLSLKNGTFQLNNANTYTGGTSIDAAGTILLFGNDNALGTGTLTINNSSTLQASSTRTIGNAINFGADTTISGSSSINFSGNVTLSAALTRTLTINNTSTTTFSGTNFFLSDLAGTGRTLVVNGSGATSISAVIANFNGSGTAGNVTYSGTNTLTLSGTNTYTGNTTVSGGGTISVSTIGNAAANGNVGAGTTINLGSTTSAGTLLYTGSGETTTKVINLLGTTGGGTIDQSGTGLLKFTGTNTATGAGNKTLTLQGSTTGSGEIAGAIVNSAGNTTSVLKQGTGTWTLSGTNGYTGTTSVTGGTLLVNGSTTASSAVTVNGSGTTLGGTGTINGTVTVGNTTPGAIINPGPSGTAGTQGAVGTLTTGALTMTTTNTIHFDVSGTAASNWDKLVSNGVTLGSTTLDISMPTGLPFVNGTVYTLVDNTSATPIVGAFTGIIEGNTYTFGGYDFTASYLGGTGNDFTLTAIPEPSTWIGAALALAAIGWTQRKRIAKGSRVIS
jgi:autotransporter-associated beta strand protein